MNPPSASRLDLTLEPRDSRAMILLDSIQLPAYLQARGLLAPERGCRIEALSGGVSNVVLRVDPEGCPAFVVKQSRE